MVKWNNFTLGYLINNPLKICFQVYSAGILLVVPVDGTYLLVIYVAALVLQIANMIRFMIDSYSKPLPAILEIPSKDHPYDPSQDSILSRVKHMFSSDPSGPGDRK